MSQSLSYLIQRLKPYWLDDAAIVAAIELNKIILFPSGGAPVTFYPKTQAGLAAALAAAAASDAVWIPACTIAGNHTIPAGVTVIGMGEATILSGVITNNGVMHYLVNGGNLILDQDELDNGLRYAIADHRFELNSPTVIAGITQNAVMAGTRKGTEDVFYALIGDGGAIPEPILVWGVYDSLDGGITSTGSQAFIGSQNGIPFFLRYNNQPIARIDANGPWLSPLANDGVGTEGDPYTSGDNTGGIQGAITVLAGQRGGKVLLNAGRYDLSAGTGITISTPSIHLVGAAGGFNDDPIGAAEGISGTKIRCTGDGLKLGNVADRLGGIRIEEIYLWADVAGNKNAITVIGGLDQMYISRLRLGGNWKYGLYCHDQAYPSGLDACHFHNWAILGISGSGVYISGDSFTIYTRWLNCEFDDNDGYGFYNASTNADNRCNRMMGCTAVRNQQVAGLADPCNVLWGSDEGVIESSVFGLAGYDVNGNLITDNADGLIVTGDNNVIIGNQFIGNSGWGIRVRGNKNIIVGNDFDGNVDGCIIIEAGATDNVIIQPGEIGCITDNGTDTIIIDAGHDPVTLDADAATFLDLNVQEIGLDVQNANTVFAGPTAAPANEPTFRLLSLANGDISDIDVTGVADGDVLVYDQATSTWLPDTPIDTTTLHEHIINEDHTAECDGAETGFATLLDFRAGSTQVYLNGIRQRIDVHYTEDGTLDGITFDTAPEAGDELIIDYICSYADYLLQQALILDSDGIGMSDSDDELIADSTG